LKNLTSLEIDGTYNWHSYLSSFDTSQIIFLKDAVKDYHLVQTGIERSKFIAILNVKEYLLMVMPHHKLSIQNLSVIYRSWDPLCIVMLVLL